MRSAVLLSLLSLALCENMDEKWHSWKSAHGKFYVDSNEESERRLIWTENYGLITQHNNANRSFSLGLNEFADMTQDEFQQLYLAQARSPADVSTSGIRHVPLRDAVYGDSIDWREKGYVTAVKNQGQCGSCWAFSATGALEGQMYRTKGSLTSLSEQQLVDCSWKYGNSGCNGGLMDYAFVYVKNSGLCSSSSYPYLGYTWRCKSSSCSSVASCSGYKDISSGSESDLLDAVSRMGPVSVAIDASSYQFQFYSSGVYTDSSCSSSRLNHGVLVVGYGTTNNKNYWIVKNSWGTSWGSSGYINMYRGSNMCGIASAASYPTV